MWSCSPPDLALLAKLNAASTTASTRLRRALMLRALAGTAGRQAARMRLTGGSVLVALPRAFFWRRCHLCQRGTGRNLELALLLYALLA